MFTKDKFGDRGIGKEMRHIKYLLFGNMSTVQVFVVIRFSYLVTKIIGMIFIAC